MTWFFDMLSSGESPKNALRYFSFHRTPAGTNLPVGPYKGAVFLADNIRRYRLLLSIPFYFLSLI